ncbi:MAG TPA: S4 domain-containing protein [Candidatus Acidoferrum sp.]|nr:S4 domain-containing protein [Candidatus Acidoferrum sp.]
MARLSDFLDGATRQKKDAGLKAGATQRNIRTMQERLQKIIARAGIASRRHAEQLILSGQVRVNGQVVRKLGTKADAAADRIEAAGKVVGTEERHVYLALNKPPEVVATMADPEGRKTLRNCLRGLPERVYPVGRLDYAAAGLVFLTNDGDLAAEMLRDWGNLPQVYQVKVKGRLTAEDLERLGKQMGARMRMIRQPDAARGLRSHRSGLAGNFWYEVTISSATAKRSKRDSKRDALRRVLFAEQHPVEKLKRIGLGPLTLEGLPQGRYRLLEEKEVSELRRALKPESKLRLQEKPGSEKRIEHPDRAGAGAGRGGRNAAARRK